MADSYFQEAQNRYNPFYAPQVSQRQRQVRLEQQVGKQRVRDVNSYSNLLAKRLREAFGLGTQRLDINDASMRRAFGVERDDFRDAGVNAGMFRSGEYGKRWENLVAGQADQTRMAGLERAEFGRQNSASLADVERNRQAQLRDITARLAAIRNQSTGEVRTLQAEKAMKIADWVRSMMDRANMIEQQNAQNRNELELADKRLAQDSSQFNQDFSLRQQQFEWQKMLNLLNQP